MSSSVFGSNSFISGIGIFIMLILTVLGMVFLYLTILPKKKDGSFNNKILQMIHDYFNFKKLYIESVLKFLFTLFTVACVAVGISTIITSFFGVFRSIGAMIDYGMPFRYLFSSFFSGIIGGILTIIVGPVVLRLVYEGIMMFILLVKNVIDINNKTKAIEPNTEEKAE